MTSCTSESENLKKLEIILNEDMTSAYFRLNMTQTELDTYPKDKLISDMLVELKNNGVVFGVKREFLSESFELDKEYLVAEGLKPFDGEDSIITMYEIKTAKAILKESETADFYDVQVMNRIKAGDWLGEKIDPTDGFPGKSVKGEPIAPNKGINYPLCYDKQSVIEITFGNKTILYSKNDGIVCYNDKDIFVSTHLEIDGDVGYATGNIEFEGYVTVKGTVCDGFSVLATKDIEILGDMGLGNVKRIESTNGSIFIKGGIASKGSSELFSKKDIYAKFIDTTQVTCEGSVHIGFYSINCNITAKEVLVDSMKGKILGGMVKAQKKISAPFIGSESEKKTVIEVSGFDRKQVDESKTLIDLKIEKLKLFKNSLQETVDYKIALLGDNSSEIINKLFTVKQELELLETERNYLISVLKVRGSGEIQITKKVFPGVKIIINAIESHIRQAENGGLYYVFEGDIKKI